MKKASVWAPFLWFIEGGLKYMTKSEIEKQRSSLLVMTQSRFVEGGDSSWSLCFKCVVRSSVPI